MGNDFSPHSINDVMAILLENPNIISLDLSENNLGVEGVRIVTEGLMSRVASGNKNFEYLNIAYNNIGYHGAVHVAKLLRGHPTLKRLNIDTNLYVIEFYFLPIFKHWPRRSTRDRRRPRIQHCSRGILILS